MGYDEELSRVVQFATAAKEALPDVLVVAPSTCSWWFCESNVMGTRAFGDLKAHIFYRLDECHWVR